METPRTLNLLCRLVLLQKFPCEIATSYSLDRLEGLREPLQMMKVARIAKTIASLPAVGGPLRAVLTLRPTELFLLGETAITQKFCRGNAGRATNTGRHSGEIKKG